MKSTNSSDPQIDSHSTDIGKLYKETSSQCTEVTAKADSIKQKKVIITVFQFREVV